MHRDLLLNYLRSMFVTKMPITPTARNYSRSILNIASMLYTSLNTRLKDILIHLIVVNIKNANFLNKII